MESHARKLSDLSRLILAFEREGGWIGQPIDRFRFFVHLATFGQLLPKMWPHHPAGCWYGSPHWTGFIDARN